MLNARSCALCGRSTSTPKQGGIVAYTWLVQRMRIYKVKLKADASDYLHVRCAGKALCLIDANLGKR